MLEIWFELMILQTLIGYCFVVANVFIGLYNIKDLNVMKGDLITIRFHKRFGWIEISIFYLLFIQCMYMLYTHISTSDPRLLIPSGVWAHSWIGGLIATIMVTIKFVIARYKKDDIYKIGMIIGPIGFLGWSLSHWTSLYNFYFVTLPTWTINVIIIPPTFIWSAILPFPFGIALFLFVNSKRKADVKKKSRL
jgi:hypothetical protein